MTGRLPQRKTDGDWEYTSLVTSREEAGFQTMEDYIWQRYNMVAQYINTQSLLGLYDRTEGTPGARVGI